ncbi:MAG: phenylacetate--CoA ligase family protein [Acidobacteriota bacterium]
MSDWKERLYPRLPVFLQNLACGVEGRSQRKLRYGGEFRELLDWLEESQWQSAAEIREYQDEQLRSLVEHAYRTAPFYRRRFDDLKLRPDDIKTVEDLQKLPVLTKEDVRENFEEMVSSEFARDKLVFCHTSGTTGKSLQFYQEPRAIQFRLAVWWRHRQRFGVKFDAPYATFTGLAAVPLEQQRPPFWRENRPMRQTIFTMHHIVPAKVRAIVGRLNEGGFDYYSGYPSIIFVLAGLIEEGGHQVTAPPKMIFTGAENLYDNHRRLMHDVFKADVTDEYGFSEGCGNASRCERDVFHEDFEFGILECAESKSIEGDTHQGRILATGFGSHGMPFIRYDVGDVGTWKDVNCECGRRSKVLTRIDGRVEDFVITPEGRKILRFDYIFKDAHNVRDAQVVQRELGRLCLRIVRRLAYSQADEDHLRLQVRDKISARLIVEFEYVDEIEREPGGKVRAVKSLVGETLGREDTAFLSV